MAIKDLEARQGDVNLVAEVEEISEARTFEKFGTQGRVANAVIKDKTGTVKLTLWNEQIDTVKEGDKIAIKKGYVSEWQGELQLTTGKFGALKVLEEGEAKEQKEEAAEEEISEPVEEESIEDNDENKEE